MKSFIVDENGEHNGGHITCSVCGSRDGAKWSKNNRGNDSRKWTQRITCLSCGSTERSYRRTGEIIEQKLVAQKPIKAGY